MRELPLPSKGEEEGEGLLISEATFHRPVSLTQFGPSLQSSFRVRGEADQRLDAKHVPALSTGVLKT